MAWICWKYAVTACFNYFVSFQEKEEDSDSEVAVAAQPKSEPVYSILEERRQGGLFSSTDSDNEGDDLFSEPKAKPAPTPESKKKVSVSMWKCENYHNLESDMLFLYLNNVLSLCVRMGSVVQFRCWPNVGLFYDMIMLLPTHNNRNCDNTVKSIELLCSLNSKYLQV